MNQITIAGRLTRDAEIRQAGGDSVASFSIAETLKTKDGERPQYFDCSLFGKRGEALSKYLTKGSPVTVTGTLTTREHNGKTYLQVRINEVALQGGKRDSGDNTRSDFNGTDSDPF